MSWKRSWMVLVLTALLRALDFHTAPKPCDDPMERIWWGNFSRTSKPSRSLKIFSWNIERGLKLPAIVAAVEKEAPDLCLFQEVDLDARRTGRKNVAEELAQKLALNYVFGVEFEELSQGSKSRPAYHGQAILATLPIHSPQILRFSHQSDFWRPRWYLPLWSMFQPRLGGCMALIAEVKLGDMNFVFYNLHLESRGSERLRLLQLQEVLADANRYPRETPIVLAGDLNTKSNSSPLISFLEKAGFRSTTGNGRMNTTLNGGARDWIFARGPVRVDEAKVHREIVASDHYPISLSIHCLPDS